jgi:hypothetical protein
MKRQSTEESRSSATSSKSNKSAKAKAKELILKFEAEGALVLQPGSILGGDPDYHYFNVGLNPSPALLARLSSLGYEKAPDHVKRVGHSPAVLYCVPKAFYEYRKEQSRKKRIEEANRGKKQRKMMKRFFSAMGKEPGLADRLLSGFSSGNGAPQSADDLNDD